MSRSHKLSEFECPRCGVIFDEEEIEAEKEWEAHVQQCQHSLPLEQTASRTPLRGKLTQDEFQHLKDNCSRRGKPEDNWYRIWDNLFPDLPRPASPYVDIHREWLTFAKPKIVARFGAQMTEDIIETILEDGNAHPDARVFTPGEDPRPMPADQGRDPFDQSLLAPTDAWGTDVDEPAAAIYPASEILPRATVSSFLPSLDLSPPASTSANVPGVNATVFDANFFAPAMDGYVFPPNNFDASIFGATDVDPDLNSHNLGWPMSQDR